MIFLIFRSKIFLDVELIYTLSLKNSWETNSYSLVCRAQSFTHACNTHARVTYLPLFNLHFYSSRYLSNIYISVNESTFFHTVCQLFDIIKDLFEFDLNFWVFIDIFLSLSLFSFCHWFSTRINHYSLWKSLQNITIKLVSYQSYR